MDISDQHPSIQAAIERLAVNPNLAPDVAALSERFAQLGTYLAEVLPDHPDTADALRKLWESKNCAVYVAVRSWPTQVQVAGP